MATKRLTEEQKEIRRDVRMLERASLALEATTPRMRLPTLQFLWDKYVTHARRESEAVLRIAPGTRRASRSP